SACVRRRKHHTGGRTRAPARLPRALRQRSHLIRPTGGTDTMKTIHCITGILLAALPPAATAQKSPAADRKPYCWEEKGVQVCGDTVPADAVDLARTEISAARGTRTREVGRALTDEERAAAALAERAAAEAELAEAERKRRDLAMVESYATEDDLRRAY